MGSFRNVYGDANALFRTADLRAIHGYEPDRDSTCEDWEAFVKLVNAGYRLDVVPEALFYYRHRPESLLRNTHPYRNQRRVLRQYFRMDALPSNERVGLWSALLGMQGTDLPAGRNEGVALPGGGSAQRAAEEGPLAAPVPGVDHHHNLDQSGYRAPVTPLQGTKAREDRGGPDYARRSDAVREGEGVSADGGPQDRSRDCRHGGSSEADHPCDIHGWFQDRCAYAMH